jgi:hypothetical protein
LRRYRPLQHDKQEKDIYPAFHAMFICC